MKISVDVEISPEELRRFLGLPDLTPAHNLIVERLTRQVERGLDSQLVPNVMRTMIAGGIQSWEAYQKMVAGMMSAATRAAETPKRSEDARRSDEPKRSEEPKRGEDPPHQETR